MGADLLLTVLVHDEGKKLDWAAGRRTAQRLDRDALMNGLAEVFGEEPETVKEARKQLNGIISDLKAELTGPAARDSYTWLVGGKVLHIRGGTSWGEDPSEGWTAIANAYCFPEVLTAIGFDLTGARPA